jgi:hypothetical protein
MRVKGWRRRFFLFSFLFAFTDATNDGFRQGGPRYAVAVMETTLFAIILRLIFLPGAMEPENILFLANDYRHEYFIFKKNFAAGMRHGGFLGAFLQAGTFTGRRGPRYQHCHPHQSVGLYNKGS